MKIKDQHYNQLKNLIAAIDKDKIKAHKALNLGTDKGLRFRWDVLFMSDRPQRTALFSEIYAYANDKHVDTALRAIIRGLNL